MIPPHNMPTTPLLPRECHGTPTLLVAGRLLPIPAGLAIEVGSARNVSLRLARPGVAPRHACFVRLTGSQILVRSLDPDRPARYRGQAIASERLEPGAVVQLGRTPALIGETGFSRRYPEAFRWQGMVARDPATLAAISKLATVAAGNAPVWIAGESGTGKELAARAIHATGDRAGSFVGLNCAALPETLAEGELFGVRRGAFTGATSDRAGAMVRADGGTLLLDEVGDLPASVQAKLLRVLETGEVQPLGADRAVSVDVRVVAATWRDPRALESLGGFRFDLLQRLEVLRVDLPPLRERPGDIGPLLEGFLGAHDAEDLWPGPELMAGLEQAVWPGNVRQLRTRVTRAVIWGDVDELSPTSLDPPTTLPRRGSISDEAALVRVRRTLDDMGGNRVAAARALGVSRSTLYRWLSRGRA